MYSNIPFWLSLAFVAGGLVALAWSSDLFVEGAASLAKKLGISPFIIGMVIVGFGTCAPEFFVSLFSGVSSHASLAIGNAYGSCVFNIAGILGIAALVAPLVVKPSLVFVGTPLMLLVAALSAVLLGNGVLTRGESLALLAIFFVVMPLYCIYDQKKNPSGEDAAADSAAPMGAFRMTYALLVGLGVMVGASHLLVWGSVDLARTIGVGELVIGLTIVAIGTSVPELAAAIAAARKGASDLVLGNIVGSNLFNMLCVVGTAGASSPTALNDFSTRAVVGRDLVTLALVTLMVFFFGVNWRKPKANGVVNRAEGAVWTLVFVTYLALTLYQEVFTHG